MNKEKLRELDAIELNRRRLWQAKRYPHGTETPAWELAANRVARDFAPQIVPCNDCGAPVIHGYCCNYCGSVEP